MWQTIKEIHLETGVPQRTLRDHANKMVVSGEWEVRQRKEQFHWTAEYRKRETLVEHRANK